VSHPTDPQSLTPAGDLTADRLNRLIGYQLAQATIAADRVFREQVGRPYDLRPVEYTLLTLIADNPGCSSSAMAQALSLTAPNMSMWIDRLVARGWVQRCPSRTDRRKQELSLSAQGVGLVAAAGARLIEGERSAFHRLSPAERAMLLELLHKVAQHREA